MSRFAKGVVALLVISIAGVIAQGHINSPQDEITASLCRNDNLARVHATGFSCSENTHDAAGSHH